MNKIINIAMYDCDEIEIDGVTYRVTEGLKSFSKKLLRIYQLAIVVMVVVGINVAPMIGSSSFFSDVLFIVILLTLLSFVFNFIANRLLKRILK